MLIVRALGQRVEFWSPDTDAVGSCEHDEGGRQPPCSRGPSFLAFLPCTFPYLPVTLPGPRGILLSVL